MFYVDWFVDYCVAICFESKTLDVNAALFCLLKLVFDSGELIESGVVIPDDLLNIFVEELSEFY